jgi:hypothetical protein
MHRAAFAFEPLEARALMAVTPVGGEFLINSYTAGDQYYVAMAMDADGDFVTVWQSANQDGSGAGIFGQRFNAAGVAQGSEFRVNNFTSGTQQFPAVAMSADGDFLVTWESNGQDGEGYGVYARRYNAAGVPAGSEFQVNSHSAGDQRFPNLGMDPAGNFVVTWSSLNQDGSGWGVYAQRFNSSGTSQGGELQVNSYTAGHQANSTVAVSASGDFVVSWTSDGQDGNSWGIFAQRFDSSGVTQGSEFQVNTYTTNYQSGPSVGMDSDGNFVVVWQSMLQDGSYKGIYAQRYDSGGGTQGGEFRVSTETWGEQFDASIAMEPDGDFVVTWTSDWQDGSGYGVYAQRYDAAGVARGGEFRVNARTVDDEKNASVGVNSDGDFVVTWISRSQDGSGWGIYGQRYDETTGAFRVNTTTLNSQEKPAIAMDADGDFVAVWESGDQDGSLWGVYGQRFNAAGIAQGPEFLVTTNTVGSQLAPTVAMDADGDFVVAWSDGLYLGIYAQRFTAAGVRLGGEFRVDTAPGGGSKEQASVAMDADGDFVVTWQWWNGPGEDWWGVYAQRFNAAGVALGTEFRVNTHTTNIQLYPSTAMDADGDFVIAWQSHEQDGDGYGIYAQRYNAAGEVQGAEFRINTTTMNWQGSPAVAMNAAGDFVVTWQSNQEGSAYGIYGQRFDRAGVPLGGEFHVNTFTTGEQRNSSVAMDADGDFVVTWRSLAQDGSGEGIYAQKYNTAGVAQGGEFLVNTYTANAQVSPAVAIDATGDFVVTWQSAQDWDGSSLSNGIFAKRFSTAVDAAGPMISAVMDGSRQLPPGGRLTSTLNSLTVTFSENLDVTGGAAGANSVTNPANWRLTKDGVDISSNVSGVTFGYNALMNRYEAVLNFATALTAGTYQLDALSSIRDLSGNSLDGDLNGVAGGSYSHAFAISNLVASGGETLVNTTTASSQVKSKIAMDADGDYVVAWSSYGQDGSGYGIYAQRFNAAGVAQGGEIHVSSYATNSQHQASVAMDTDGDFVVVWQSHLQDGSGYGIYGQRFNAAGAAQGSEFRVNSYTTDDQEKPSVAMDANGDFVVTWSSYGQDGSFGGIFAQRYNAAGTPQGSEFQVNSISNNRQESPVVAMDSDGDFVIAWQWAGRDGSLYGVYAQRFNERGVPQGTEFRVNSYTTGNQISPAIAIDADGDFVVTWTSEGGQDGDGDGIYGQRFNAAGLPVGVEFLVNTFTADFQRNSAVAMDSDGDFIVTWTSYGDQAGENVGVYAQRFSAAGVAQGSEFRVNTTIVDLQQFSTVAMDADGDFVLTWSSQAQDSTWGWGVYSQRYMVDVPVGVATNGILTVTGTELADEITASLLNPVGSASQLLITRNGVHYTIDPAKVNYITLAGLGGADTLSLANSIATKATLNGGSGDDVLVGGRGNDLLIGGAGADTYRFDTDLVLGNDTIDESGGGVDTLDFSSTSSNSIVVNLAIASSQVVTASNHSLALTSATTMENVIGGELGDTLTGNTLANSLAGGPGNDRLNGGLGNDKLFGDAGNDTYLFQDYGVSESDEISDTSGAYDLIDFSQASLGINLNLGVTTVQTLNSRHQIRLHQDNGIEAAVGGRGNDTLRGNALNNRLLGGGGNDVLVGGAGNDVLIGGARNDRYFFDADTDLGADTIVEVADAVGGVDVLDFTTTTTVGVNVDLSKTSAQEIVAGKLTLTLGSPIAVEGVNGTSLADLIIGNSLNNLLIGGAGNDIINAGAGLDFVIGGLGADVISGGDDDDLLISGRTSYDSNLPQLFSLQKTWVSNLGYLTKVSRLRTGSGVAQLALGVTVFDDGESNSISGNTGRDWFFAQLAQISDLSLDEEVN